ncbi:hypothetical protein SETIT_2G334800v2 [Setaria italica]|uniref:Uncharacterized protein n=1 Tax=Setaria italica TaxID=4555 RepID=A0A368Q5J6_SETIT|nr:hypothetical protein SETIT_2G334800v2 [Setaria italica]
MARPPKKPWPAAVIVAESVLELVAELRYYPGGENYTSGRYAGTHAMLFSVEHHLRALDLDGDGMLVRGDEIISLPASEVMLELVLAMERLSELVEDMKAAAEAAGAGGGNGGCAVALWLALLVGNLSSVCYRGKHVLGDDAARREVAELERRAVPPESVGRGGAGAGDASPKYRVGRLRIGRSLRARYY